MTYELDGALWYKATDFGAEKDRSWSGRTGNPTYFAADIAYHRNKFQRGFDRCIDIWGADHHGHVARMKGAMNAVGLDGSKLDVVLMQLVKLVRNGEIVRMSKRTGKAIQLADLLDEVPVDAARFLFNMREANSQMEFDLDLAVQQDAQNPVYYVQYAHARICSILKALEKDGVVKRACSEEELLLLVQPEELSLIRHLAAYTGEVVSAAKDYDPARITRYVIDLANLFHKFYNACRVKGEEDSLCQARLTLCVAVKTVIHNVLTMLKFPLLNPCNRARTSIPKFVFNFLRRMDTIKSMYPTELNKRSLPYEFSISPALDFRRRYRNQSYRRRYAQRCVRGAMDLRAS